MSALPLPIDPPDDGFRRAPAWLVAVGVVAFAQAGLALSLFGGSHPWRAVTDDRPVLSGRHPLHQYHGTLGADTFRGTRNTSCYDPAFQAGYPKTPVFDGSSRPAELFALFGGRGFRPAAYKVGLFAFLVCVPLAFVAAARGAGLPAGASVLAGCAGALLVWSPAVAGLLRDGQFDLLAAGLAAAVFVPWLGRYARQPGPQSWGVLALLAAAGWYAHPFIWIGLGPVMFAFYFVYAPRHGPGWHLGLAAVVSAGVVPNLWWLAHWARFWWLRQPSASDNIPLPELATVLGEPHDYAALCVGLPGGPLVPLLAVVGIVRLWLTHHRAAAGLSLVAVLVSLSLARLAATWPRVPADVPAQIAPLAAAFLVPAAAFAVWGALERLRCAAAGTVLACLALFVLGWADGPAKPLATAAGIASEPLVVGFSDEQKKLIAAIEQHTTPDARILWDDANARGPAGNWSALLPLYTNRSFLGGLDCESEIDHGHCALSDQRLNGRPLADWTDAELTEFCRWYNVGWVVCRGGRTAERWAKFPAARPVAQLTEAGQPVLLIAIDRPHSFVLSGSATWEAADTRRIVLTDVQPDADGFVLLSLHWFEELRVYPSYVKMEGLRDPRGRDPIHMIRLKAPGPIPRLTLVWEHP